MMKVLKTCARLYAYYLILKEKAGVQADPEIQALLAGINVMMEQ